ncbi:transposase [Patescibacteria group bacterium]|nr:transposase [Patescibacteria group bacterium]
MPYRKEKFDNGDVAHITLRAIDDNLLFKDVNDYYRGIFSIYEFNNSNPVSIQKRRKARKSLKNKMGRGPSSTHFEVEDEREKLVEVFGFCFMPNHIHLLVRQAKDDGIVKFMSKVGTGLGGYFNRKNQRKGHVFQDRFYPVRIKDDTQLKVAIAYIHTNPLSLIFPKWKEVRINDINKAVDFLDNEYRWSSHFDYIGKENFPSVTDRELILELLNGPEGYKDFIKNWIENKGELK